MSLSVCVYDFGDYDICPSMPFIHEGRVFTSFVFSIFKCFVRSNSRNVSQHLLLLVCEVGREISLL